MGWEAGQGVPTAGSMLLIFDSIKEPDGHLCGEMFPCSFLLYFQEVLEIDKTSGTYRTIYYQYHGRGGCLKEVGEWNFWSY